MLAHAKNVVLRKLEPKDLDAFHAYRSDPVVARYQGWSAMHREGAQSFFGGNVHSGTFGTGMLDTTWVGA